MKISVTISGVGLQNLRDRALALVRRIEGRPPAALRDTAPPTPVPQTQPPDASGAT